MDCIPFETLSTNVWAAFVVLSLVHFQPTATSVSLLKSNNQCVFNLTDGDFDEFDSTAPSFYECVHNFSQTPELILRLQNYRLPSFPNSTFSNLGHVRHLKVEVSNSSQIQILLPTLARYTLFGNSTFDSVEFDLCDIHTLIGWKWNILSEIDVDPQDGFQFNVVRSRLVYLHADFSAIAKGRVTVIRILKCQMRWLGDGVFAPFSNLKTLELRDNFLESIKRSHLPTRASVLRTLDLGKNRLRSLPEDLFDGLELHTLLLEGNNLKISEPLANKLVRSFPWVTGALWPCRCGVIVTLLNELRNSIHLTECYAQDGAIHNIAHYKELC